MDSVDFLAQKLTALGVTDLVLNPGGHHWDPAPLQAAVVQLLSQREFFT